MELDYIFKSEKKVSMNFVNKLLQKLGHTNILVVDEEIFYWDGEKIVDDLETKHIFEVGFPIYFSDDEKNSETFEVFLERNKNNKIIFHDIEDGIEDGNTYNLITVKVITGNPDDDLILKHHHIDILNRINKEDKKEYSINDINNDFKLGKYIEEKIDIKKLIKEINHKKFFNQFK